MDPETSARLAAIEAELAHHRDLRAVEDVLTRYSRALDWLDDEGLADVFWDDAEVDYGFFKGTGAEFRQVVMAVERGVARRWHFTSQVKVRLDGDVAEAESYNFSVATNALEPGGDAPLMQFYGYYEDRLERRAGRWAIARRRHLLVAGSYANEVGMDGDFAGLNRIGATSPEHPEFRRLR